LETPNTLQLIIISGSVWQQSWLTYLNDIHFPLQRWSNTYAVCTEIWRVTPRLCTT